MFAPLNPPVRDWPARRVWIVGASSGIGAALADHLLQRGARVALSARRADALESVAAGRSAAVGVAFVAAGPAAGARAHGTLPGQGSDIDLVVFCAARYQPEHAWELQAERVRATIATNLEAVYFGLETVLPRLLAARRGGVVLLASVAGYTGLPTATVYGPTKAALINLGELLHAELRPRGLGVYLVNPGFVRTRLTERNGFPMPALQTPQQAAEAIVHGLERGRFEIHFPRRFTVAMQLLRRLPYRWRFAILRRVMG